MSDQTINQDPQPEQAAPAQTNSGQDPFGPDPFESQRVVRNDARAAAELIPVDTSGVTFDNFAQMVDWAKHMATSRWFIPSSFRGNIGMCLAVTQRAKRWGMDPFDVANGIYVVNDRIAYMAGIVMAVINKFAGLKQRLRPEFTGEGEELVCKVTGHFRREPDPCVYESPPIGKIQPKNSQLWKIDPRRQLFYWSARAWARMYAAEIMLNVYTKDELEDSVESYVGFERARDVTNVSHELAAALQEATVTGEGFHPDAVANGMREEVPVEDVSQDVTEALRASAALADEEAAEKEAKAKTAREGKALAKEAKAKKASKVKADVSRETVPKVPKTAAEYRLYLIDWLVKAKDQETIEERWRNERQLRNRCQVTSDERSPLEHLKNERVAQLGG